MERVPLDEQHAAQVVAGTAGRLFGHRAEERLAEQINLLGTRPLKSRDNPEHLVTGAPAVELLNYICNDLGWPRLDSARAWWTGGLATTGKGDSILDDLGVEVSRSKSDVVLRLTHEGDSHVIGVGVKTCGIRSPTNAQLYFTTASAFSELLRQNEVPVSGDAERALRMFCGDAGFRPADHKGKRIGPPRTRPAGSGRSYRLPRAWSGRTSSTRGRTK